MHAITKIFSKITWSRVEPVEITKKKYVCSLIFVTRYDQRYSAIKGSPCICLQIVPLSLCTDYYELIMILFICFLSFLYCFFFVFTLLLNCNECGPVLICTLLLMMSHWRHRQHTEIQYSIPHSLPLSSLYCVHTAWARGIRSSCFHSSIFQNGVLVINISETLDRYYCYFIKRVCF